MTYRIYAFGDQDVDNSPGDLPSFSPGDIRLDAASTTTTLIISLFDIIVVAEGNFSYNSVKTTFADVSQALATKVTTYKDNALVLVENMDPSFDLFTLLFGPYQNQLNLYTGNDEFIGSSTNNGSEAVRGGPGNDRFTGYGSGPDYDFFNGESGFDIAFLRGKFSDYTIKQASIWDITKNDGTRVTGFEVIDQISGRDGLDYYNNVERLYFSDGIVALDIDGNAGQSYRLYKAALDRVPDGPGLAGWIDYMDKGGQLPAMSQMFIDSPEFIAKYGPLDDAGFVDQLYLNVLDRNADPAGLAGWLDAMANGASRSHVLIGFSESTENQANVIGQIQNGIPYVGLNS